MSEILNERPISIAMLALGGQGGGVLTKWLVGTAESNGFVAQSTYVAGVAQRTGATVYCVEMFPRDSVERAGRDPIFTPYPIPGDVDIVVAGEMAETGRAIEKGFVTPNATTLIASSHRVYAMTEKETLGDGILDLSRVAEVAEQASRDFICFDMQAAADETGSVISSVLFGAIAASNALPFDRAAFEETIRQTGRAVEANLKGFAAGFDAANKGSLPADKEAVEAARPEGPNGQALAARIASELPPQIRVLALHGALRALEYQDADYANEYVDRIVEVVQVDSEENNFAVAAEVVRQLALQMCYEDTIRVADLKTRGDRVARVRTHVAAQADQPVHVFEYVHPRLEEVCDTLPAAIGGFVLRSPVMRRFLAPFLRNGRTLRTSGVFGFLLLHLVAKMKRFRRGTFRYGSQSEFIRDWLNRILTIVRDDYDRALALAHCIEIVRGYGSTYERGMTRYKKTVDAASSAASIRKLHRAALADEQGKLFDDTLASLDSG